MKKATILLVALLATMSTYAQGLQLGVRVGVNNGNLSTKISGVNEGTIKNGFLIGAYGRASLLGLFVQPEINYSNRVGNFEERGKGTFTNTITTLDVNALVGYNLLGMVHVLAGPTLMTFMSTKQEASGTLKDVLYGSDFYNSSALGFQLGAGIDIGKLCVDLRYDHSLTSIGRDNVYSGVYGHGTNYSTGFSMWQLSIGYKFINF